MFQIPQVSLLGQKISIEHMTKFMRKQAADNLVAVQSAANLRDDFVAAVILMTVLSVQATLGSL